MNYLLLIMLMVMGIANYQSQGPLVFEDFEGTNENSLPEGWLTVATPSCPNDAWKSGTLYTTSGLVPGPSGESYAYITTQENTHDAWLFSPAFDTQAGQTYVVSYWMLMVGDTDLGVEEEMYVTAGYGQSVGDMNIDLEHFKGNTKDWTYVTETFTAERTDKCHIGFHATSPGYGAGILIDNFSVCEPNTPAFYGKGKMEFEDTYDRDGATTMNYSISNVGSGDLVIDLKSTDPEISIEGLPLTLIPGNVWNIQVSLNVEVPGQYEGSFILETSDPTMPEVEVLVSQTVNEANFSGYWLEDFNTGLPTTWESNYMYLDENLGLDASACAALTTQVDCYATTGYTSLGSDPYLKFYYRFLYNDFFNGGTNPTPSADVYMTVSISVDGGTSFEPIFELNPETNPHEENLYFNKVEVPLTEYAGKICQIRFDIPSHLVNYMNFSKCYLDNVELGTPEGHDLEAMNLRISPILHEGEMANATVTVRNNGLNQEQGFAIALKDADSEVTLATIENCSIGKGEIQTFTLQWMPQELGSGSLLATVQIDGDSDMRNNSTALVPFAVIPSDSENITFSADSDLTTPAPWDFYSNGSLAQMIYSANEIGVNEATIYGVAFVVNSNTDYDTEEVELWIGEINQEDFSSQNWINPANLTHVYSAPLFLKNGKNEVEVPFDEPFYYNGGNLILFAAKNNEYFIANKRFDAFATEQPRTMFASTTRETIDIEDPSSCEYVKSYNHLPAARFIVNAQPTGSLSGSVTSVVDGSPLAEATITIDGTMLTAVTDSQGHYNFPKVALGEYALTAEALGYYGKTSLTGHLSENECITTDFVLDPLPVVEVHGRVTDAANGEPISGVGVVFTGYVNYYGVTNDDGSFSITNVFGDVKPYQVEVIGGTYLTASSELTIGKSDMENLQYSISPRRYAPHSVQAVTSGDGNSATITWEVPMADFRCDSGIPADYSGFENNFIGDLYYAIEGNSFDQAAVIKEISWHTTSRAGNHKEINLFLFPLDEVGFPIHIPLFEATVDNIDDEWNTYVLPEPISAPDGFLVAMSYSYGMMGISTALPTEDYPLSEAKGWYHSNFSETFGPMYGEMFYESDFTQIFMIRAAGDNEGAIDFVNVGNRYKTPMPTPSGYNVYRCTKYDRELIGSNIQANELIDSSLGALATDNYYYAVEAVYGNRVSDAIDSNSVRNVAGMSAVTISDNITITPRFFSDYLNISNPDGKAARVIICNLSGNIVLTCDKCDSECIRIDTTDFPRGMYVAQVICNDGSTIVAKLVK